MISDSLLKSAKKKKMFSHRFMTLARPRRENFSQKCAFPLFICSRVSLCIFRSPSVFILSLCLSFLFHVIGISVVDDDAFIETFMCTSSNVSLIILYLILRKIVHVQTNDFEKNALFKL